MARILVIDDQEEMRLMLEQMLGTAGHEVIHAADGAEGMDSYRARPADLVITDLVMPGQEGLETIIKLRKEFPKAAIIAMSGKTGAKTMLTIARRLGAVEILEKPFAPESLLHMVGQVLRGA